MSISTSRRRFIAGATCPQCGQVDKVFTQTRITKSESSEVSLEYRERGCVACEFLENIEDATSTNLPSDTEAADQKDWAPIKLPE